MQSFCTPNQTRVSSAAKCRDEDGRSDLQSALLDVLVAIRTGEAIDEIEATLNDVVVFFYRLRDLENPNADTMLFSVQGHL